MGNSRSQGFLRRIRMGGAGTPGNSRRTRTWVWLTVLTVVALATCGLLASLSGRSGFTTPTTAGVTEPAMYPTMPAGGVEQSDAFNYRSGNKLAGQPGVESHVDQSAAGASSGTGSAQGQTQPQPWDRKIIRTATLQLTVSDVVESMDRVRTLAYQHGAYVFQSDSHQNGEYTIATITVQVPTQEFDRIMPELRKLGGQVKKITSENVSSTDVTEEYTDLQSQLRNLQATEARLLALQQKAEQLQDILTLDQQLRQIQGDIERIQGRLNFLSNRADLSSISITLNPEMAIPEPTPVPAEDKAWDPGEVAVKAWNASLDVLSRVATVAITVTVFLWWAIPLLLIGLIVAVRARRRSVDGTPPVPPTAAAPLGEPSA